MNNLELSRLAALAIAATAVWAAPAAARAPHSTPLECSSLAAQSFPGFHIVSSGSAEVGALPGEGAEAGPPVCRVAGVAAPSGDSAIGFEVWIPSGDAWNGKIEVFGNGGYVGRIPFADMKQAVAKGYAAAGGDTGHITSAMPEDLTFVVGHPEKMKDWGCRSIHAVVGAAKVVISAVQGEAPKRTYFLGCSTGGGQGLAEAQRYPLDFDGIVAGAPGNYRTHLNAGALWGFSQNNQTKEGYIPEGKFGLISKAVMKTCDALDGVSDGIISDPSRCRFSPGQLACSGFDAPDCLTRAQVATLKRLYGGAHNPRTGAVIYPPWPVGTEAAQGLALTAAQPPRLDFWKYWVFNDPNWDWRRFDFDKDLAIADAKVGPNVNNTDPDLKRFTAHGGKLLLYHGWADPIGNAFDTIDYFKAVQAKTPGAGQSVALYMIPGMSHCRGGPGADTFDKAAAIEAWVERGEKPQTLIAAHLEKGVATLTRPICPYPSRVVYDGRGDPSAASSFTCKAL